MMWSYAKDTNWGVSLIVTVAMAAYAWVLFTPGMLTHEQFEYIVSLNIILSKYFLIDTFSDICSRLPQIYTIFSTKSTGSLAFLTVLLTWLGSIARLATVLNESDDFMFKL